MGVRGWESLSQEVIFRDETWKIRQPWAPGRDRGNGKCKGSETRENMSCSRHYREARGPGSKGENRLAKAGQGGRNLQAMRSPDIIINPEGLHPHWKMRERSLRGVRDSRWFQPWNLTKPNVLFPISFHLPKREQLFTSRWIAGCFDLPDMPPELLPPLFFCNKIYAAKTYSMNFKPYQVPTTRLYKGTGSKAICYKPCQTHSINLNTIQ